MALSVIPFIIVEFIKIFSSSFGERIVILISLVVSSIFLFLYFIYQVFHLSLSLCNTEHYIDTCVNLLSFTLDGYTRSIWRFWTIYIKNAKILFSSLNYT
jgi:uncharacterized membrane protein